MGKKNKEVTFKNNALVNSGIDFHAVIANNSDVRDTFTAWNNFLFSDGALAHAVDVAKDFIKKYYQSEIDDARAEYKSRVDMGVDKETARNARDARIDVVKAKIKRDGDALTDYVKIARVEFSTFDKVNAPRADATRALLANNAIARSYVDIVNVVTVYFQHNGVAVDNDKFKDIARVVADRIFATDEKTVNNKTYFETDARARFTHKSDVAIVSQLNNIFLDTLTQCGALRPHNIDVNIDVAYIDGRPVYTLTVDGDATENSDNITVYDVM